MWKKLVSFKSKKEKNCEYVHLLCSNIISNLYDSSTNMVFRKYYSIDTYVLQSHFIRPYFLLIYYIWLLQTSRPDKHREEKTQPAFSSQLYSIFSRRSGFHIRTEGVAFDLSYNQVIKSFCLSVHIILYLTLYFVPPKLVRPYYFYFIFISLLLSLSNLSKRQPCKLPL